MPFPDNWIVPQVKVTEVKIPTWTTDSELEYLAEVAKRSGLGVESGCYLGASAKAMLVANPQMHLWTVDHFKAFEFNKQVAEIFLHEWIASGQCELIDGNMDKAGEMLAYMNGKIDFIFCDNGHDEASLQRDIRNGLNLLRSGGEILGHDWDGDNDVARGVLSMLPREKLFFPRPRIWAYIKP